MLAEVSLSLDIKELVTAGESTREGGRRSSPGWSMTLTLRVHFANFAPHLEKPLSEQEECGQPDAQ